MVSSSLGIVDSERLLAALRKLGAAKTSQTVTLMRTILIEGWFRNLRALRIVNLAPPQNLS